VATRPLTIPRDQDSVVLQVDRKEVRLTNLRKIFWPELGLTKGDLLQYYATMADVLLPHIRDRAMVMKRYPNGASGPFFFMKRAPVPRPSWIETCSIEHGSGSVIDFPMVQDRAALMWVINLGCIDLNQWYARCDDVDRPDYLHFDLDPGVGATFDRVRETALIVGEALDALKMPSLVKTTGSKGLHLYVPIVRGPEKTGVDVRQGARAGIGIAVSRAHHGGVPRGQASARPRAGRLQPERMGPNARVDLFRAPSPRGDRLGTGHVERGRTRPSH